MTSTCRGHGHRLRGRRPRRAGGDLLRKVLPWSLGLLLVMCLFVTAQSTAVLGWMLP
ncbi:hypothetical protein ABZY45_23015 [Streptomyces sp. NPDC006516]|uniref:hypothetical protein n=1 Tax=Streptomyces sp. NPDC006516 TaxID=3154309 RepID=UPI0033A0C42F